MKWLAVLCCLLPVSAAAQTITAVNGPLASMARTLAGDAATVIYPVPDGTDPALWRPSVEQISDIQNSDLILLNGADFARWAAKTSLPRARTVVTSRAFEDTYITIAQGLTHSHGADGEHSHDGIAPNTWLDFAQAAQQAEAIAKGLKRVLPAESAQIDRRLAEMTEALMALDTRAKTLAGTRVVVAHGGLEYFTRAYALDATEIAWTPGQAPSAEDLARLDAAFGAQPPDIILWQTPPHPQAQAAAKARGLVSIVFDPGTDNLDRFVERMAENLAALAR